jgi:hypothetical protein
MRKQAMWMVELRGIDPLTSAVRLQGSWLSANFWLLMVLPNMLDLHCILVHSYFRGFLQFDFSCFPGASLRLGQHGGGVNAKNHEKACRRCAA